MNIIIIIINAFLSHTHTHKLSYTSQVSLQSATVNHSTHVIVELTDSSSRPASLPQNVTAQLETVSEEPTPTKASQWQQSKKPEKRVSVSMMTPSRYKVSYTAVSRGQHKLHIQVNDRDISGSPFTITVYPDPTTLRYVYPETVTELSYPYGIAINKSGEMVVSEWSGHRVLIFDNGGQKLNEFGSDGWNEDKMNSPAGIDIDNMDNIYVSSRHKLQKFTSSGVLIKCVGQEGREEGEFDDPRGVTLHNNQDLVYVCDRNNHRIQVFDLDLNFVRSIGRYGKGSDRLHAPLDVKFDTTGNMYVADWGNRRVQVIDSTDHWIQSIPPGEGDLGGPSALHIADKYLYVSDFNNDCIRVYKTSGNLKFVTKFGKFGQNKGRFDDPYSITSCPNGYIYVCDCANKRVQIF